jgi:hypothetical protein
MATLQLCLDESKGEYSRPKVNADSNAAVEGSEKLIEALRQDPDTRYVRLEPGYGSEAVTMRKMAALVAGDASQGGGCEAVAQSVQTALNGLPGG